MIVLEEAWALLKNPIFAAKIEDWLKTFRKLNAIVVFSTQSVEDAVRSPHQPGLDRADRHPYLFSEPQSHRRVPHAFSNSPNARCI